jgi:ribosomal-protein-alanine N-acetyltransferase
MLALNFDPFPVLETERLILRKFTPEDATDVYNLRSNPEAMRYIGKSLLRSVEEAEKLIAFYLKNISENISITWGISLKGEGGRVIGTIGYHTIDKDHYRAEIGYMIHPDLWGKGYMNEAISVLLQCGLNDLGFHSIEAKVNPENEKSCKILLKHGFVKEAHFKENFYFEGKFQDTAIYSIVKKV